MNRLLLYGIFLFVIGNILAWFQANSQFLWQWWYDRPIFTVLLYSIPTSLAFFYGWRYAVESLGGSLWSARMLGFGVATIMFGLMSYFIKDEGVTSKTAICLILSLAIILIQLLWKD